MADPTGPRSSTRSRGSRSHLRSIPVKSVDVTGTTVPSGYDCSREGSPATGNASRLAPAFFHDRRRLRRTDTPTPSAAPGSDRDGAIGIHRVKEEKIRNAEE